MRPRREHPPLPDDTPGPPIPSPALVIAAIWLLCLGALTLACLRWLG